MLRIESETLLIQRAPAFALGLFLFFSPCCLSQDDPGDERSKDAAPTGTVFSRIFGSSTAKKSTAPAPTKNRVPATPTAGRSNRNGFFVPLKSFTKAFRGTSESDLPEESDEDAYQATPMMAPRIPREPFRAMPRLQERRDREVNDIQVEEQQTQTQNFSNMTDPRNTSLPAPRTQYPTTTRSPAPIVRAEPAPVSKQNTATKPQSPVSKGTTEKKIESNAGREIVIESGSTSRRSALDSRVTEIPYQSVTPRPADSGIATRKRTANTEDEPLTSITKRIDPPESLLEIGESVPTTKSNRTFETPESPKTPTPISMPRTSDESRGQNSSALGNTHSTTKSNVAITPVTNRTADRESRNALPTSGNASKTIRESSIPGVRVSINGPDSMLVNKEGTYEIVTRNEGVVALNGMALRVAVPQHVAIRSTSVSNGTTQPDNDQDGNAIVWELEHVPAGGSQSVRLMLQTTKPEHFGLGIEWTVLPQSSETKIQVQQPQLELALEGPSEVEYGKPQMYRVRVRNPGNADVKAVSIALSAEPYGSNQSEIGDIVAGSERVIDVELTFQQSGTLPIKASAKSAISELSAESSIDIRVRQAELTAQWRGPSEFYLGGIADYELEVINLGSIAAIGTRCKMTLPVGTDSVTLPAGSVRKGDLVQWEIAKIEPQEKLIIPVRLSLNKLGNIHLDFKGECVTAGETKAEFSTLVDSIADLHLSVSDPVAPAPIGQPVVYEIVIVNRGKKSAPNVEVVAQFSDGIEPIRVEGQTGNIVPGQVVFNAIPSIGPNEKKILKVFAEASIAGVHRFRAEVKCVGSDADLLEEESTRFIATGAKTDRR